jgi:hypothetical protein
LHHFLPGASSIFAGPYPVSYWHPNDHLRAHHVVQSACHLLCSKGELSGLFLIIHQQIQSGALICRSSWRGISVGSSSFCMCGYGRRSLSILGAVRSLLPPGLALCPGHSVPFSAAGSQLAVATASIALTSLTSACSTSWHGCWERHWHGVFFGLDSAWKWSCILVGAESSGQSVSRGS